MNSKQRMNITEGSGKHVDDRSVFTRYDMWSSNNRNLVAAYHSTEGMFDMSDQHSPAPGVLETVVSDEDLLEKDVSTHASRGEDTSAVSKQAMKAYSRAKKASKARDLVSRRSCALLRAKREGNDHPFDPVIIEESSSKVQTLLSDF